jgi:deoxyribose-phosphate aldolase
MIYTEYACLDYSINEIETTKNITDAIKYGITNISVLPYTLNTLRSISDIKDKNISVSCPIDFPLGVSDLKTRSFAVSSLCKTYNNLISSIDLFIPTKTITNRKYDKFRDDIKTNLEICNEFNIQLRYILEYRIYNHDVLAKVCQILMDYGINTVLPSSGTMIDDIHDNLIACNFLMNKSKINTIATGNIYNDKQVNSVIKMAELYGIRLFNIHSLHMFIDHIKLKK